ncbi:MAG: ATP-dependent DNA helicase RecG [Burkholderiales bacterium]|nr:ATP-dependent DNA helicase RecG [Burkholderiales bacterium]
MAVDAVGVGEALLATLGRVSAKDDTEQTYLPPALRPRLARLGIAHLRDLLLHLPLRYEDQTRRRAIADLAAGDAVIVEGIVEHAEVVNRPRRQFVVLLREADSATAHPWQARLTLRYFNFYPTLVQRLRTGASVRVFGEVREGRFGLEMIHPVFKPQADAEKLTAVPELTPIYPSAAGVPQAALRTLIGKALRVESWQREYLPSSLVATLGLPSWGETMTTLHTPSRDIPAAMLDAGTHPAWRRVKFDELLAQQLALRDSRALLAREQAPGFSGAGDLGRRLRERLPFRLTAAQERSLAEVLADLGRVQPMTRLLQGDVGSGKTVVAALAALMAVESGWQVAFMAPTELLAEQHFNKLRHWLDALPVSLVWLSGSLATAELKAAQKACQSGAAQIAVGTHALFQKKVRFARLGLVVVDEQHRFGVEQRLALRSRGRADSKEVLAPHQLMMSATPIPRSLAMSYYADLDVSVIDELPGGRQPITTKLVRDQRRSEVIGRIHDAVRDGAQAYWVCPLIDESEKLAAQDIELQNATALHEELTAAMPDVRVALLHGRMKADEKAAIMADFVANRIQVLVATTVIEVGVDVPNASWMVIEHAERFGLAQLHQLRGRVGRGSVASTCILLFGDRLSDTARQRLKVIYETTDGFTIAREDLRIRGPGELLGPRQSGLPSLRYANIENDLDLVEAARDACAQLERDSTFDKAAFLARWLQHRAEYARA